MVTELCAMCGKEFEKTELSEQKYCSVECRNAGRRAVIAAKPPKINQCAWCGKPYSGRGKYCGEVCGAKGNRVNRGSSKLYAPNLVKRTEK